MSTSVETATREQVPVFLQAAAETIFGIYARPLPTGNGTAVLISSGGLTGTSTVGRNQMFVRLAHRLTDEGFASMRFDYHGIGESTGLLDEFRLDVTGPFVDDILGAAEWVGHQGVERTILLGKCFGSRMALAAASSLDRLAGVVLIGPPVRDFGKGERAVTRLADEVSLVEGLRRVLRPASLRALGDPRRRRTLALALKAKLRALSRRLPGGLVKASRDDAQGVSRRFVEPLEALLEQGIPVQLIYGRDDDFYREFQKASQQRRLGRLLERHDDLLDVTVTPGQVRGFVQGEVQDAIIDAACTWISRRGGATESPDVRSTTT